MTNFMVEVELNQVLGCREGQIEKAEEGRLGLFVSHCMRSRPLDGLEWACHRWGHRWKHRMRLRPLDGLEMTCIKFDRRCGHRWGHRWKHRMRLRPLDGLEGDAMSDASIECVCGHWMVAKGLR
jgi:hypothetical protein